MSVPHLLIDEAGAILLDTGFPGDWRAIRRKFDELKLGAADLKAVVLTHGHIDHAGNAAWAKAWSGASIFAHPLEQRHIDGVYPYRGASKVCGVMERLGRLATGYRRVSIDVPLAEGDELPFWGGLRVVHLPGHTDGHCGFYSARHDLLFSGDLWVRFMMRTQVSPAIFSDDRRQVWPSMMKARALGARRMVPGHYDFPDAVRLRRRFEELCDEYDRRRKMPVV